MKFLADENIESPIVSGLRAAGHDVLYIIEVGGSPSDGEVIKLANREKRILLTNDKGFGERVFRNRETVAGVVLLRFKKDDALLKARIMQMLVERFDQQLVGMFTVVNERRVRMKKIN